MSATIKVEEEMLEVTVEEGGFLRVAADEYHADRARCSRKQMPKRPRRRMYLLSREWHQANRLAQDGKTAKQEAWKYKKRKYMRCEEEDEERETQKLRVCIQEGENMKTGDTLKPNGILGQKRRHADCEDTNYMERMEERLSRRVRAKLEDSFSSEIDVEHMAVEEESMKHFELPRVSLGETWSSPASNSTLYSSLYTSTPSEEVETASVHSWDDDHEEQAFTDSEVDEFCEQNESDAEKEQTSADEQEATAHQEQNNHEELENDVVEESTARSLSSNLPSAVPDVFNPDGTLKVNPKPAELKKMNDLLLGFRQHLCRCLEMWDHPVLAGGKNEVELEGKMQTQAV